MLVNLAGGLALFLYGMHKMTEALKILAGMSQATAPLRTYELFLNLMQELQNPLLGVLIGAVFTALVQSSSATIGIVIVRPARG